MFVFDRGVLVRQLVLTPKPDKTKTRAIWVNLVYRVITLRNYEIALEMHLEG